MIYSPRTGRRDYFESGINYALNYVGTVINRGAGSLDAAGVKTIPTFAGDRTSDNRSMIGSQDAAILST